MIKKLKNSLMLLVALATVGITLMSNKGISNEKKALTFKCYRPSLTVDMDCIGAPNTLHSFEVCAFADVYVGAHIFSLNPSDYMEEEDIATECFGFDSFCCAQVVRDPNPCLGQAAFNLEGFYENYRVAQVFCKID